VAFLFPIVYNAFFKVTKRSLSVAMRLLTMVIPHGRLFFAGPGDLS
jgi:hypothetical protein